MGSAALQSVSQFGDALSNTADFYSKAALDDQFNQLEKKGNDLLYGGTGPGAQPGYLTLNGKQAMDGRPSVEQSLDGWIKEAGGQFQSDAQKAAWQQRAEAYQNNFSRTVGSHADSETQTWVTTVNQTSAKLAQDRIAADPTNPKALASGFADLLNAYTKNAELAGASKGDPVWSAAVRSAQKDALIAQVSSLGATDPSRALNIVQKNRDLLGTDFDNVYTTLRTRAVADSGEKLAQTAMQTYGSTGKPLVRVPGQTGLPDWSDSYFANVKAQESGGNANAKSSTSSATGLYQFTTGTWNGMMRAHPELGLSADGRTDPAQQEKAVRAYTADNATALSQHKVPITPGNLYLAAFFGSGGAAHLYDLPGSTPMDQAVSGDVLKANGWLRGKTVDDVRQWAASKAGKGIDPAAGGTGGGAPSPSAPVNVGHPDAISQQPVQVPPPPQDATIAAPVAPAPSDVGSTPEGSASAKAQMVQAVLDSDAEWPVKEHAISVINEQMAALQIAADSTAAAKKAANDDATNKYVTTMLSPNADFAKLRQSIVQDQDLTGEAKLSLTNALTAHADGTVQGDMAKYGPAYFDVMKRVIADPGNPLRISDPTEVLKMAAPGPYGEPPSLTLDGANSINQMITTSNKSPADASVTSAKVGLVNYAKQKLSYEQDVGPLQIKDPKGEALFNGQFIPKFEKAYSDWVAAGKAPFDFLTQENVDKLIAGMRNPHEMAMEKLQAMSGVDVSTIQAPPPPAGADADGWKLIVNSPPRLASGQAAPPDKWAQAVQLLAQEPNAQRMGQFDQFFGTSGVTASDVLDVLGIKPHEQTDEERFKAARQAGYAVINGVIDESLPMPKEAP